MLVLCSWKKDMKDMWECEVQGNMGEINMVPSLTTLNFALTLY